MHSITYNVKSYKKFNEKAQTTNLSGLQNVTSATSAGFSWKNAVFSGNQNVITRKSNFHILYPTMCKSTSSAFQKCGTFCVYDFLKGSYWLSKFSNISIFFDIQNRCQKKKTRPQFWVFRGGVESGPKKVGLPSADSMACPKNQNCGRVFFFWHRLFFVTNTLLLPCADFEQQ